MTNRSLAEAYLAQAEISKRLRKERELAFYGDLDCIPTAEYSAQDAAGAYADAAWTLTLAREVIGPRGDRSAAG